ncbi:MAG TPA: cell cycle transcriptional regulator TrcR [Devosiaceae bacterium]|nr:cell cycle transcriptional regulator TrcR [Devosiaceae bacterium]
MANQLLMPKATAVWLIDNTALTFDQIAAFCTLHPLEVQGIADGDVAQGIKGVNPMQNAQLDRAEIDRAETDPAYRMKLLDPKVEVPELQRKGPRYTPVSKRQEKPNAILWLVRNHPELKDSQIMRLVGTTKPTIESVRERTHWNASNQAPLDPVTIGLCTQSELDMEVRKAAADAPPAEDTHQGTGLMSAEDALARAAAEAANQPAVADSGDTRSEHQISVDSVFGSLKSPRGSRDD